MGQYLSVGIAKEIFVYKSDGWTYYTKDEIEEKLSKVLNLDLYDISENEKYVFLNLKQKVFSENIYNLLENEYEQMKIPEDVYTYAEEVLQRLKNTTLFDEVFENNFGTPFFELLLTSDISYVMGRDDYLRMEAYIISIFSEGKVLFECYNEMVRYLRNKIISTIDNPLKDAIFVSII